MAYSFYSVSATLVKISLLLQYLRILKEGWLRYACIGLMVLSSMWGFAYSFLAFFPCFPVKAYWDWSIEDATCYGYGVKEKHPFVEVFVSHAAINVLLDVAILVVPVPILLQRAMSKKEKWSVFGLASMGIVYVLFQPPGRPRHQNLTDPLQRDLALRLASRNHSQTPRWLVTQHGLHLACPHQHHPRLPRSPDRHHRHLDSDLLFRPRRTDLTNLRAERDRDHGDLASADGAGECEREE